MKSGISQRRLSMTQYDRESGEEGIFAGYINTFLRIKQESSGYTKSKITLKPKELDWRMLRRIKE